MSVVKNLVKTVLFLTIFVIGFFWLDSLMVAKNLEGRWDTLNSANSFYDLKDNTVDVFFVGTSGMAATVDPYQLYEEHGIVSYNLAMASQSSDGTYYWLKEMFTRQKPSLIVLDAKTFGRFNRPIEPYCRKSFDAMRWGKTKIEYAQYYKEKYEKDKQEMIDEGKEIDESKLIEYSSYFFPFEAYHSRWSSLNELDFVYSFGKEESKSNTRGYMMMSGRSGIEYEGIDFSEECKDYNLDEDAREYFYKILDLCNENGALLMLLKTPDSDWVSDKLAAVGRHRYVEKMASEKNVLFYDMNSKELFKEMEFNYATDASDYMHLNTNGARKATKFIGNYIKEHFDLKDYRNVDGDIREEMEKGIAKYKCEMEDANLRMTFNITDYYNSIENRENYAYLITVGGGFDGKFTEKQKLQMRNMGFSQKVINAIQSNKNFIAVVDGKNCIYQESEKNGKRKGEFVDKEANPLVVSKEGKLSDGTVYKITSKQNGQSIVIGTNKEIINRVDKCYMITYDKETHKVVDAVFFDKDDEGNVRTAR